MTVLAELRLQRDRIAGRNGWRWVSHIPGDARECCAVMYNRNFLSGAACESLQRQLFRTKSVLMPVAEFNDNAVTQQEILDLFDGAIEYEENQ